MAYDKSQLSPTPPEATPSPMPQPAEPAATTSTNVEKADAARINTQPAPAPVQSNNHTSFSRPYRFTPNYQYSGYTQQYYPRYNFGQNAMYSGAPKPMMYRPKQYDREAIFKERYGTQASKRDKRRFNRWWNSDARHAAQDRFEADEHRKQMESWDAINEYNRQEHLYRLNELNKKQQAATTQTNKYNFTTNSYWDAQAKKYGFANREALADWQAANGLVADGKFGNKSLSVWNRLNGTGGTSGGGSRDSSSRDGNQARQKVQNTPKIANFDSTMQGLGFKKHSLKDGSAYYSDEFNNRYYNTGRVHRYDGTMGNYDIKNPYKAHRVYTLDKKFANNPRAVKKSFNGETYYKVGQQSYFNNGQMRRNNQHVGNWVMLNDGKYYGQPLNGKVYNFQNGGNLNYYQQGGSVEGDDIKTQVTQLVQAAMNGDQQATQQVQQIMQAAQEGNSEATQLAQIIQDVMQELQGQAVSAKYGSKLKYIKNLKAAKGCKVKKNVSKHQDGGWLELIPGVGTVYAIKRAKNNGMSWKAAADIGLNLLGDVAMVTGVGGAVKGLMVANKARKTLKAAKAATDVRRANAVKKAKKAHEAARTARYTTRQQLRQANRAGDIAARRAALAQQQVNAANKAKAAKAIKANQPVSGSATAVANTSARQAVAHPVQTTRAAVQGAKTATKSLVNPTSTKYIDDVTNLYRTGIGSTKASKVQKVAREMDRQATQAARYRNRGLLVSAGSSALAEPIERTDPLYKYNNWQEGDEIVTLNPNQIEEIFVGYQQ